MGQLSIGDWAVVLTLLAAFAGWMRKIDRQGGETKTELASISLQISEIKASKETENSRLWTALNEDAREIGALNTEVAALKVEVANLKDDRRRREDHE